MHVQIQVKGVVRDLGFSGALRAGGRCLWLGLGLRVHLG